MTFNAEIGDGAQLMDVLQLQAALAGYSLADPQNDCEVTPASAGGLAVDVSAGTARLGGAAEIVGPFSDVALPSADPTDPRKALVYLNSNGDIQTLGSPPVASEPTGEERAKTYNPQVPIPSGDFLPLAEVWIPAGASSVSAGDIRSRRVSGGLFLRPAGRVFSDVTPLPAVRDLLAAASLDGSLYAIGGEDTNSDPQDTVYRYAPATDSWSTVSPLPAARGTLAAASLDGSLYAIGGEGTNFDPQDTVFAYVRLLA